MAAIIPPLLRLVNMTHSRQSGASGASCGGFLANLRCGGGVTVNVGTKQRFSLLLVAKDRENPVVGAKNAGRWSR